MNTETLWKAGIGAIALYVVAKIFDAIGSWISAPMLLDIGHFLLAIAYGIFILCGAAMIGLWTLKKF
jgi:hypothetical protein